MGQGGIYALACLRGGAEYGEKWHEAGMRFKKQNVFDDFIAAAEYLVSEKYTQPKKLAIMGGSNGGLLVGAVLNQRPDLFGAAVAQVGVMDMLRFQKFTIGWNWTPEYGSAEASEAEFKNLFAYSPMHNVKKGPMYPPVLITTADHDDRVVPAHSFKYAATMQAKADGGPFLIRIETKSGHGSSNTAKLLDSSADSFSFIYQALGVTPKY
jgi:prolyl oligopeptidase